MKTYSTIIIILTLVIGLHPVIGSPQHVYYFYIPYVNGNIPIQATIMFISPEKTEVALYRLEHGGIIVKHLINITIPKLKEFNVTVASGAYKIVANRRISILIYSGKRSYSGIDLTGLFPSLDGGYIGKEFIVIKVGGSGVGVGENIVVHAMEDTEIKIYDTSGRLIGQQVLKQNETALLKAPLSSGDICHVVSTGRIVVSQVAYDGMMFAIDATGKFKGTNLYAGHTAYEGHLLVFPYEKCRIRVTRTPQYGIQAEYAFSKQEVDSLSFFKTTYTRDTYYRIVSDKPVTVLAGDAKDLIEIEEIRGIAMLPVPANTPMRLYAPSGMIIFAPSSVTIKIRSQRGVDTLSLQQDQYYKYPRGVYEVVSDKPILIEVIGNGSSDVDGGSSIWDAEFLVSSQDLDLDLGPPARSKFVTRQERSNIHTIFIIVIVIVIIVLAIIVKKFKSPCVQSKRNFRIPFHEN